MSGLIGDRKEKSALDEMIAFTQEFNEQCREEARIEAEKKARKEAKQKESPKAHSKQKDEDDKKEVKNPAKKEEPAEKAKPWTFLPLDSGLIVAAGCQVYCVEPGRKFNVKEDLSPFMTLCLNVDLNDDEVYAGTSDGRVFNLQTKKQVADLKGRLDALCSYNNYIYGASFLDVYDVLSENIIAKRKSDVVALCLHDGAMYDAGGYKSVWDTINNKCKGKSPGSIVNLCSHNSRLYSCGGFKGIFSVSQKKIVAKREKPSRRLCSHNGKLYDTGSGMKHIIYETLKSRSVAEREFTTNSLCSCNGKLYDGGVYNSVYDTLNDPTGTDPVWLFEDKVYAMLSVPFNIWEKIARKGKLEK